MSAITGIGDSTTMRSSALTSSSRGTAQRTRSPPASAIAWICFMVASKSAVSVLVIDWTATGAPPPIFTPPTSICFLDAIYRPPSLARRRAPRFRLRSSRGSACASASWWGQLVAAGLPVVVEQLEPLDLLHAGELRRSSLSAMGAILPPAQVAGNRCGKRNVSRPPGPDGPSSGLAVRPLRRAGQSLLTLRLRLRLLLRHWDGRRLALRLAVEEVPQAPAAHVLGALLSAGKPLVTHLALTSSTIGIPSIVPPGSSREKWFSAPGIPRRSAGRCRSRARSGRSGSRA